MIGHRETRERIVAEIVGGDLYHLWRVSDVHLPRIADVYYDANRVLSGAKTNASGPRTTTDTAAMSSSAAAAWADLRDELQSMYAQIGETVLEAAEGIRRASAAFVEADLVNADALSDYMADPANHDPDDAASSPPAPHAPDHPGEPVLPG
jgi:hypothetical protein